MTGTPIRGFMKTLLNAIEEKKQVAYLEKGRHIGLTGNESEKSSENQIILIGEPVIMESLAAVIETEYQISVRVICPLREKKGLLADGDIVGYEDRVVESRYGPTGSFVVRLSL